MTIEDFIDHNLTGYLFSDLDTMANFELLEGRKYGGVNYPMLMTILAGIELLGALVNPRGSVKKINNKKVIEGDAHFVHFWQRYLSEDNLKYKGLNNLFYHLLRNGIAHTFIAKHNIYVYKSSPHHLSYEITKPELVVGCKEFAKDLKTTYEKRIVPILSVKNEKNPDIISRGRMQSNLDDLLDFYEEESRLEFSNLPPSKNHLEPHWYSDTRSSLPSLSNVKSEELQITTPSGIKYP